jgi:F-type H+-transporting ATPase subunit delta
VAGDDPIVAGAAGRYATALFDLAREGNALDAVAGDLSSFERMLSESTDLQRLVRSPVFSAEDQSRAVGAIVARTGASPLTSNFLGLIARNRRLFAVPEMIKGFRSLLARHRREVTAEVVSAHPLNAGQLAELKATLKSSVGQDVQLSANVDPSLLGGLVVKVGSRMIDSSLRTKLNNLKIAMKEVR